MKTSTFLDQMGQLAPDTICVDLDGTLVRSDTLTESLLRVLCNLRSSAILPRWFLQGRGALKLQVTARATLNLTLLPYEETLIERGAHPRSDENGLPSRHRRPDDVDATWYKASPGSSVTRELSAPRIVAASTPSRIGARKLLRSAATLP